MNTFLSRFLVTIAFVSSGCIVCSFAGAQITKEMRSTTKLFPTTEAVTGRVVDDAGWPIVGAVVVQYGKSDGYGYSHVDVPGKKFETLNRAVTDLFGNFEFKSYDFDHVGDTKTYFLHSNYAIHRVRSPFEVYGDTVLSKGEDVIGRILSHDGNPLEGVEIAVSVPSEEITGVAYGQTKTDKDGRFLLNQAGSDGVATLSLTIPGEYTQRLTWFSDEGVDGAVESVQRSPDEAVIGQDFEFRLGTPRTMKLRVVAEDTERPIMIDRVMYRHFQEGSGADGLPRGHYEILATNNLVEYDYLKPGVNRFWLFPVDTAQYPAVFVDVKLAENENSVAEIEVKIPRGASIQGQVADRVTGERVADALVKFLPVEPGKFLNEGIFVRQYCRTQNDGSFFAVLPAGEFDVQIVGDCGNYQSIPDNLAENLSQSITYAADGSMVRSRPKYSIPEALEKRIELNFGDRLDIGIFQLEPGTKASGVVFDPQGQPLANVGFVASGDRYSRPLIPFGTTDERGRFEIESLFTNAAQVFQQNRPDILVEPTADVFFFDAARGLSKMVTVKESESTELRVTLVESLAIWGRVVDAFTGEPLSGVKISGNGPVSCLILGAMTDNDGSYLLEHLPRDGIFFSFGKENYQHHHERFELRGVGEDRLLIDVQDIRLINKLAYGRPDKPDVDGLTPRETVNELLNHITKELAKLPAREDLNSWNSEDPDTKFKSILTEDVGAIMDRLLNENNDSEFQIAATLTIFDALSTSQGGNVISSSLPIERMREVLLKNLDRNEVFDSYTKFRFGFENPDNFEFVLDNSQTPKVRLWSTQNLIAESEQKLTSSVQLGFSRTGPAEFQKRLRQMEKAWRVGLTEFSDENANGALFQSRIRESMKRVVSEIEQMPHDEERLNAIKAVIAALDEI